MYLDISNNQVGDKSLAAVTEQLFLFRIKLTAKGIGTTQDFVE